VWTIKRKLNEEKSKHASLALQNGFGPAFFHTRCRPEAGKVFKKRKKKAL
jgi:hypothetical protein